MNLTYETFDRDLAAYLVARAYPVLGVWGLEGLNLYTFPAEAAASAEAFYAGATAPAKNVLHAARQLESMRRDSPCEYVIA